MQTIDLMQNNFKIPPLVYMVQNDTGRTLKMNIRDNTLEAGDTAGVAINRSDGSYYTISATRVSGENAFSADMTQALTQPGLTKCQLKVKRSGLVVSSYMFAIMAQPSTDGVPEEQIGYNVQDLMEAAQTIISGGFTPEVKAALLQIAAKVAYIDEHGQDYYDALDAALNPPLNLAYISAVYTQSGEVYDNDSLDSLKADLVVTAYYTNGTSETLPSSAYTLTGTLTIGTSTITVSYGGKTDEFNVTVTAHWDLNWDYTQGTPIGHGFSHSNTVVGSMVSDGYQIKGTSSGGCNIVLTNNGSATKGVTEIVFKITSENSGFIGLHFDVKNFWAYVANKYGNNRKTYYCNTAGVVGSSNSTAFGTYALDTEYKIRFEWDNANGATLYINDTPAYTISGALGGTDRERWMLASSDTATTAVIKSIKVRLES